MYIYGNIFGICLAKHIIQIMNFNNLSPQKKIRYILSMCNLQSKSQLSTFTTYRWIKTDSKQPATC